MGNENCSYCYKKDEEDLELEEGELASKFLDRKPKVMKRNSLYMSLT